MNKRRIIQHAKNYLDLIAAGTDPISQETIGEDSVATRPQIIKCFQFVSAILQEVLENNGLVLLDTDEAALQMQLVGHDFFVFRNSKTNEVNVLYKRHDGNLGLIEPDVE